MNKYDVIFIGGGPAGYTGAMRACELGLKTLLIEKEKIGGACLHWGCIPTKAMLASASLIDKIGRAGEFGLEVRLDTPHKLWRIVEKKDAIVDTLENGLLQTLRRKGVEILKGNASFKNVRAIVVKKKDGEQEVEGGAIVIATGSRPQEAPGIAFNRDTILSSNDILSLHEVPRKLGIVGGGVIGCEFASLFSGLGAEVFIVEMLPQILPAVDPDIARRLETLFRKRGIRVFTGRKLEKLSTDGNNLACLLSDGEKFSCDRLLVAIGRRRNLEALGLEAAGVELEKGAVRTNEFLETTASGIFAVGDVIHSPQLAHVAEAEALLVTENLKRKPIAMDYRAFPNTIFTHPEISGTGMTKEEAEKRGRKVRELRQLYGMLGKSHVERETDGLCKLVIDEETREILGGHILGERASEMIAEISLAIRLKARAEDLAHTIHAHPTFSEILWETARMGI